MTKLTADKQSKNIDVDTASLIKQLPEIAASGVTEFFVHDTKIAGDKKFLLSLIECVGKNCPDMFISFPVDINIIDVNFVRKLSEIYCSIDIALEGTEKNGTLLFDKKLYKNKTDILNREGIVFGFTMSWGLLKGDTFKLFRDRLDFALSLYPNHIDFPQFGKNLCVPKPTAVYSSKDIDFSCGMAFACRTFYTAGRAVPWFNSVIRPLKITPSSFFADFDEWQQCNNCSFITEFVPEDANHADLEKMQLAFLKEKFEEKHKSAFFDAVSDIVRLNGAFSRVVEEDEETIIDTFYNPDDLLSPFGSDLAKFCEEACLENCRVKIFAGEDAPDYRIL